MNHRNRTAAFLFALLCIVLHIIDKPFHPGLWAALLLQFLLLPHLLYLRARHAADQVKAEIDHTIVDAIAFGFWSGFLAFPIWISFIFLVGSVVNPSAFRGYAGLIQGAIGYVIGAVFGSALVGFKFSPDTSLPVTLLAIATVLLYLISVGLGVYRRAVSLHQTKEALRDKEYVLKQQLQEITLLQQQLQEQATRDSLTGLFNRRYLEDMLERALASHARNGRQVTVVMIDIDHFKRVNDEYGHPAGDAVLCSLAELMSRNVRATDVVARMGGEEFVVLLEGGRAQDSIERAEHICLAWEQTLTHYDDIVIRSTLSAGVANARDGESVAQLLRRADVALYEAKNNGRNRVVSAG